MHYLVKIKKNYTLAVACERVSPYLTSTPLSTYFNNICTAATENVKC